jgi:hypothetical protein
MNLAPIALFVYNRLGHLRQTIEALQKNTYAPESDMIIFSDGAKGVGDRGGVESVRAYVKTITGFKSVRVVEREENYGLARSIIAGVTEVVETYGKIIVLEDDMVTSPYFLTYMNEALRVYENDERVASIHGYMYPVTKKLPDTFFLMGADCWGWATWERGWKLFESDGKKLLHELKEKKMTHEFDFRGTYPYTQMLESQIVGRNNSWAIRWYASAFLAGKLTLYPGTSLVKNIGMDASGVHSEHTDTYAVTLASTSVPVVRQEIQEDVEAKKVIADYFASKRYNTWYGKLVFRIKQIIHVCVKASKKN